MNDFFKLDNEVHGAKGLVFIGEKILVYRRDGNTPRYPFYIDLPGGGSEPDETPFDTFQREVREEFSLVIAQNDIVAATKYPSTDHPGLYVYFPVAKLPKETESLIKLGDEGLQFMLVYPGDYLEMQDVAMPVFQEHTADYLRPAN